MKPVLFWVETQEHNDQNIHKENEQEWETPLLIIKEGTKLLLFPPCFMNISTLSIGEESAGLFSVLINTQHVW